MGRILKYEQIHIEQFQPTYISGIHSHNVTVQIIMQTLMYSLQFLRIKLIIDRVHGRAMNYEFYMEIPLVISAHINTAKITNTGQTNCT